MPLLTRDQILTAQDLEHEDVAVPEWGGSVRLQALTAAQRDSLEADMTEFTPTTKGQFQASVNPEKVLATFRARLAAYSIVDENGQRVFTDEDMVALGGKSGAALQRVFNVAMRLSFISEADVEELVGKSEAAPSGSSPSASASPSA